jgi:hypothetical protein
MHQPSGSVNMSKFKDIKIIKLLVNVIHLRQIQIAGISNIKYTRNSYNYLINKDNPQQVFFKNTVQRLNVFG